MDLSKTGLINEIRTGVSNRAGKERLGENTEIIQKAAVLGQMRSGGGEEKISQSDQGIAQTDEELGAITYGSLLVVIGDVTVPVTELEIKERPNRHGELTVTVMTEEQVKDYILYEGEGNVSLFYFRSGSMQSLFQGIVIRMETMAEGETYFIRIEAKTDSYLMDIKKYSLSFQDVAMSSHQLINRMMGFYPGSQSLIFIPDQPIGRIAVQYQETAWEFINRFISEYHSRLYVDSTSRGMRFRIGLSDMREEVDWEVLPYTIKRDLAPREVDKQLRGQLVYEVEAYEVLPLGTQVSFHGQELYIGKIHRGLKNGLLVNEYGLYFEEGLQIKKYHNPLLGGVSVNGVVMGISRNQVRVAMEIDALTEYQSQYYFPYSSVAASPDGSGWYCMPKAGDQVRIFFPVSDEKEGYAISNIKGQSSPEPSSPMGNPDLKDITTPDGKMVKFIANGILLSVGSGKGTVTLTNDGKAEIKSEENIAIGAAAKVSITAGEAGTLKLSAGTKVQFTSDEGSSISLSEETVEANASIISNN